MLLMIWHLDRESAIIVLSTSNIYMHEIKKKVNKKVIAFLYVAVYIQQKSNILFRKNLFYLLLCEFHIVRTAQSWPIHDGPVRSSAA